MSFSRVLVYILLTLVKSLVKLPKLRRLDGSVFVAYDDDAAAASTADDDSYICLPEALGVKI